MDTSEEGLASSLRALEHRVRPQVEAAGIRFTVEHGLPEDLPGLGPRQTLQVLRIMQEGVTNALRHSGARNLAVASRLDGAGRLEVLIVDDGKGLPDVIAGGRGLASMHGRAAQLGGILAVSGSPAGTTLALTVPLS